MAIIKLARFRVEPESLNEVQPLIKTFIKAVHALEKGRTLDYRAYRNNPGDFTHFMVFADQEAEEQHKQAKHTMTFVKGLYPLCVVEPIFETLTEL